MPTFEQTWTLARPAAEVFAFFLEPARTLGLAPPELHLRLVEAPARLELGSRVVRAGRRWGVPQRVTSDITALEAGVLLVETQVRGPFRRWVHHCHFRDDGGGCTLHERVEFEPPGGMLGLTVTEAFLRQELEWLFAFRGQKLGEIFA